MNILYVVYDNIGEIIDSNRKPNNHSKYLFVCYPVCNLTKEIKFLIIHAYQYKMKKLRVG